MSAVLNQKDEQNPFNAPALARKEFSAVEMIQARNETAATAVAAQAKAMVESRYVMALRRPRNWDQVRQDLLKECRRPSFAHNKSALYNKPIGKGVEGLGIRFVEVALRCMTNVLCESVMVYSDDEREIHRVSVTDLENNNTWPMDVTVSKTVERSKPLDDGSYISVRTNSYGKKSYTVPATDDDLLNKRLALISKALRTSGLRVIPGDLQDEAEEIIRAIRLDEAAKDPDSERKKIADAFAVVNVKAADLEKYLGHSLDTCTPVELVELRGLYGALRDGEATWKTVMDNKAAQTADMPDGEKPQTGAAGLKTAVAGKGKKGVNKDTGEIDQSQTGAPTQDELLTSVLRSVEKAKGAASEIASLALDDAADLARSLTGEHKAKAEAAIKDELGGQQ